MLFSPIDNILVEKAKRQMHLRTRINKVYSRSPSYKGPFEA